MPRKTRRSRRRTRANITTTGYKNGYLANRAKVVFPRPLRAKSYTAVVEIQDLVTAYQTTTTSYKYKFMNAVQDTVIPNVVNIATSYSDTIFNQLVPYKNMFKAIYTKAVEVEFVPIANAQQVNSPPIYFKTDFIAQHTVQEMEHIQPIVLLTPGIPRIVIPRMPRLSQQYKPVATTTEAVTTNRWIDFPETGLDIPNMCLPVLHFFCPTEPEVPFNNNLKVWMINIRIKIGLAPNAVLEDLEEPGYWDAIKRRAKQEWNDLKDPNKLVNTVVDIAKSFIPGKK